MNTRVLHFSDVHVTVGAAALPWHTMLNKRLLGWGNLRLRRAQRFREVVPRMEALADFAREEGVALSLCTGDYTVIGTPPEHRAARALIEPLAEVPEGLITVPGNHDVYMPDVVRAGTFGAHFGDWIRSDRPVAAAGDLFPTVRFVGPHLAVVGVNSARANPQPWRSSGLVPAAQLEALKTVLATDELKARWVIIATHYAPRRADASPDTKGHGLVNADALLEVASGHPRACIVHGHLHDQFHVVSRGVPLFCAGSTTDSKHGGGVFCYDVTATHFIATAARWDGARFVLEATPTMQMSAGSPLPHQSL